MQRSPLDLTLNVSPDPALLDMALALAVLPDLALTSATVS